MNSAPELALLGSAEAAANETSRSGGEGSVQRLLCLLILCISLPLMVLLALQIIVSARADVEQAEQLVQSYARVTADEAGNSLKSIVHAVEVLAGRDTVRALDPTHCDPAINGIRTFKANVANVGTTDASGRIVCVSSPIAAGQRSSVASMPWFQAIKTNNALTIGDPDRSVINKRWVVHVAMPLRDDAGAFNGAVAITIDLVGFYPIVKSGLPPEGVAGIVNRNGIVVARSERAEELIGRDIRSTNTGRSMLRTVPATEVAVGNDGVKRFYAYQPVPDTPWLVAVGIPTANVYADAKTNALRNLLGVLLATGLTIYMAIRMYRRISIPLLEMNRVASKITAGDLSQRISTAAPAELRHVATAFNTMLDQMPLIEKELRASEEEYRRLFVASPNAIRVVCDGRVVMANPAAVELFGPGPSGDGTDVLVGDTIAPVYREIAKERIARVLTDETEIRTDDLEICRADGNIVPASVVLIPFRYRGKSAVLSMVSDISAERALALTLEEHHREMQRLANLLVAKQSVSAIAHELNQPLVAISAYCEAALAMVQRDLGQPSKLMQALEGAAGQAERAGQTLHALMTFLEKGDTSVQELDLNHLIAAFIERRENENPRSVRVELDLDPALPSVKANHLQLELILSNLLQNAGEAIEASGMTAKDGLIKIVTRRDDACAQMTIRDNGTGVAEAIGDGIFNPFATTKSRGLGLGLTISKALAQSVGGQLRHDAHWTDGAMFHLTLPLAT